MAKVKPPAPKQVEKKRKKALHQAFSIEALASAVAKKAPAAAKKTAEKKKSLSKERTGSPQHTREESNRWTKTLSVQNKVRGKKLSKKMSKIG